MEKALVTVTMYGDKPWLLLLCMETSPGYCYYAWRQALVTVTMWLLLLCVWRLALVTVTMCVETSPGYCYYVVIVTTCMETSSGYCYYVCGDKPWLLLLCMETSPGYCYYVWRQALVTVTMYGD